MDIFSAIFLTLGAGTIDHQGWRDLHGPHTGTIEVSGELMKRGKHLLYLNIRHTSSIDDNGDKGINTLEAQYRVKLK